MAKKLLSPDELRSHVRRYRDRRWSRTTRRKKHLFVADEFDKLAAATEAEQRFASRKEPWLSGAA